MAAVAISHAKVVTVTTGLNIAQTIWARLPAAIHLVFEPVDEARVFKVQD